MSALAPTLEAFFTERLINQRQASPHTVAAYRDAFRLLLKFTQQRRGKAPSTLDLEDLDAPLIGSFLNHLERERGNSAQTRNARLAAIHSLFRFAALRHPEHAALIQRVLAIPAKHFDRTIVSFLSHEEIDALLAAPDRTRWIGRRDHTLLAVAIQTGLRVSELAQLCCQDTQLGTGAHVRCLGKGRKQRCTPLTTQTAVVLRDWMAERKGQPADPLFPTSRGRPLSRDAVAFLVTKYAKAAEQRCPTLQNKTVSPHTLRHSAAMRLLHAGVDTTVIALWLGHQAVRTTQIYVHADLSLKERALARTTPADITPERYRAPDALIDFLEAL
jgi:integrase/recombinase XerD